MIAIYTHTAYLAFVLVIFGVSNGWAVGLRASGFQALYILRFGDLPSGLGILGLWVMFVVSEVVYLVWVSRK